MQKTSRPPRKHNTRRYTAVERNQQRRLLEASEKRFRALVEKSFDAIAMLSSDGVFLYVSPGVTRFLGYAPDELVGRNGLELVPPDNLQIMSSKLGEVLQNPGNTVVVEHTYTHKDGSIKWVESTVTNLLDEPSVQAIVSNFRDITERKRADETVAEQTRLAAFSMEMGVALIQSDSVSSMLDRCAKAMVHHLDAAFARIWTLDTKENVLELQASAGLYTHLDGSHSRVPVGKFKIGLIAAERKPHLTNNVIGDPRVNNQEWARREGMVAFAGYPLIVDGRLVGVMAIFARRPLTPATLEAMASVANGVALGIERKRGEGALKASEARLRFMAESMPQKIFTARPNGDVDYFNPQWMEFTGLSFEEIRDWGWTQFIHPDDVEENVQLWQHSIDTGEPFQFEHRFRRFDGSYCWHLSRALPMRDDRDNIIMWVGSNTEIDDLKRLHREAQEAVLARDQFLTVASHELKTPITSIKGHSQLLSRHAEFITNERIARSLSTITTQANQLTMLINELLDVSRIESGQLQLSPEPVDLVEFTREAVTQAQMLTEKHPITVYSPSLSSNDQPMIVVADRERLRQVLVNLLDNAVKYSPEGGPIDVTVRQEGDRAVVSVLDQGIGIPAEELHHVFERFYRAPNASARNYSGLGLGLNISREIMQRHGGQLWVESQVGQGSAFSFSLPLDNSFVYKV